MEIQDKNIKVSGPEQSANNAKDHSQNAKNKPSGHEKDTGLGMVDKISKKDKMHEVYILFKELDGKMRKQQAEIEDLLKNLREDQPCP